MKYKFFLITALALFCVKAAAQNGRITGVIVDEAEDTPPSAWTRRESSPMIPRRGK